MTDEFFVKQKFFEPTDPRLGRHVRHDSRSRAFAVQPVDTSTLKSVRHQRYIPTLDQLKVGSCTGNGTTGVLGTGQFWPTMQPLNVLSQTDELLDEELAVKVYSLATSLDSYRGTYPPTDTGSDGLSAAKAAQSLGLISGYQHAFSLDAFLTALAKQPVMVGTEWRTDMFTPASDGKMSITGSVEGGHEYMFDELDVERKIVWMHNSWNDSWGIQGRAYFTWDDIGSLLAADGDVTVFTPRTSPAPTPTPVPPVDLKAEFLASAAEWLKINHTSSSNHKFQTEVKKFIAWYGN